MNESLPDVTEAEKDLERLTAKFKKGMIDESEYNTRKEELDLVINTGHDYHFVGKVGAFCPIKPGYGGGLLVREQNGKYNAATGTKGYRWLESEMVQDNPEIIDDRYYKELVDEAVDTISQYGDFEMFVSDIIDEN
jgi:hypothetical protein